MITIEQKDIVLTRIDDDTWKLRFGDIEMGEDTFHIRVGETITIPIPSVLVQRKSDKALLCTITGDV